MGALWGSSKRVLDGITGNAAEPSVLWVSYMNPRRLDSNGLINVDAGQHPNGTGTFVVTLSPIRTVDGGPLALAVPGSSATWWRKPAAFVRWGRGGLVHTALVDWPATGTTFAVTGDSLFVSCWAMDPDPALPNEPQRWDVQLGASATPLVAGAVPAGTLAPRYTMKLPTPINNAGGTSGEVFIPTFARKWDWTWLEAGPGAGAWIIDFLWRKWGVSFAQNRFVGGTTTYGYLNIHNAGPFEMPFDAQTVVVNNNTVGALLIDDARLVFQLELT